MVVRFGVGMGWLCGCGLAAGLRFLAAGRRGRRRCRGALAWRAVCGNDNRCRNGGAVLHPTYKDRCAGFILCRCDLQGPPPLYTLSPKVFEEKDLSLDFGMSVLSEDIRRVPTFSFTLKFRSVRFVKRAEPPDGCPIHQNRCVGAPPRTPAQRLRCRRTCV